MSGQMQRETEIREDADDWDECQLCGRPLADDSAATIATLRAELARLDDELRGELRARRARDGDEVWYWQGDGVDCLESLTCPVIMRAQVLRALLAKEATLRAELEAARADSERYYELLYAVACKYPNETRHETALRYIRERETVSIESPAKDASEGTARE